MYAPPRDLSTYILSDPTYLQQPAIGLSDVYLRLPKQCPLL